jgi:hypothetical protein
MRKFFLTSFLFFTLLLFSCGKNQFNSDQSTNKSFTPADTIDNEAALLDSIDRANNESIIAKGDKITKAFVFSSDSTIFFTVNARLTHRFFGYALPNIKSKRLILFSIFSSDVDNNPFGCELGAYYDTKEIRYFALKYLVTTGDFIKAIAIDKNYRTTDIYFEKKWIEFER